MKIVLFYHSLISDWNHGNAHFLRGIMTELVSRGHDVKLYEPENGWSLSNLIKERGEQVVFEEFRKHFPDLKTNFYAPESADYRKLMKGADLVIVHEWNDKDLVRIAGELKNELGYKLLFHDTHHRSVSEPEAMESYDLSNYDGVIAFGEIIRNIYIEKGWTSRAWTLHEAADTRLFKPLNKVKEGDLIWVGNWGDDERTRELHEFLIGPVKELGLKAKVYGVRYPAHARKALAEAGIEYGGYLPSHKVPEEFSKYRLTVHVPRRYYNEVLHGVPTIRPFEAMACGIPLISAPWKDSEGLFRPGKDFLFVDNGEEMKEAMRSVLANPVKARELADNGLFTIHQKHTCAHRVYQLEKIYEELVEERIKI